MLLFNFLEKIHEDEYFYDFIYFQKVENLNSLFLYTFKFHLKINVEPKNRLIVVVNIQFCVYIHIYYIINQHLLFTHI